MTKPPDIDSSEFGQLGVPSMLQSYKQQTRMLIDELDDAWSEVRKSKQTITKLVGMNDKLVKQLAVLKIEHDKIRWALCDKLLAEGLEAGRALVPGANLHQGYKSE